MGRGCMSFGRIVLVFLLFILMVLGFWGRVEWLIIIFGSWYFVCFDIYTTKFIYTHYMRTPTWY